MATDDDAELNAALADGILPDPPEFCRIVAQLAAVLAARPEKCAAIARSLALMVDVNGPYLIHLRPARHLALCHAVKAAARTGPAALARLMAQWSEEPPGAAS
jgi:hypothetical protein